MLVKKNPGVLGRSSQIESRVEFIVDSLPIRLQATSGGYDFLVGLRRESSMFQRQRCPCDKRTPKPVQGCEGPEPHSTGVESTVKASHVGESAQS